MPLDRIPGILTSPSARASWVTSEAFVALGTECAGGISGEAPGAVGTRGGDRGAGSLPGVSCETLKTGGRISGKTNIGLVVEPATDRPLIVAALDSALLLQSMVVCFVGVPIYLPHKNKVMFVYGAQ